MILDYVGVKEINGSLIVLDDVDHASYEEMVEIHLFRPVERRKQFEGELVGLVDGEIVIRDGENELRFKQKDVSLCKPLVIITEDDIAMDEEMSDDEKNDSEGR